MKKRIIVSVISVLTLLSLTACGSFRCDNCHEDKFGRKYEVYDFIRGEMTVCSDCYNKQERFKDDLLEGDFSDIGEAIGDEIKDNFKDNVGEEIIDEIGDMFENIF